MRDNSVQQTSRVILAVTNRLLREMLKRAIQKSPYLEIVGEATNAANLAPAIKETGAQWVIVSLLPDGEIPAAADTLLAKNPSLTVLAVAPDGSRLRVGWTEPYEKAVAVAPDDGSAKLRWTETHEKLLKDLSLNELIAVLRKGSLWESILHTSENVAL